MFFSNAQEGSSSARTETASDNILTLSASLPTNYLQIIGALPSFTAIEIQKIEENIKHTKSRVKEANQVFNSPKNNPNSKIVAHFLCCLAYFDLGQQYSKMAQAKFVAEEHNEANRYFELAEQVYEKVEEYKWTDCISQIYDTGTFPITPSHSKEEALQDIFAFYREISLLYFLKYKYRTEDSDKRDYKYSLEKFLVASEIGLKLEPTDNNLLFIRTIFLLDFLSVSELVDSIKNEYLQAAESFLQYSPNDNKKSIIAFCHQIIKKMLSSEPVNMSYESVIPTDASPETRWFFANIYFETVYAQFVNNDLTVFIPGREPNQNDASMLLAFDNIGMNITIANLYKFMAHFRNITAKFQVAANPRLNADILDALYRHSFLDEQGNIRSNLSEPEEALFASLMQSVYQIYFPNIPVALDDLLPTALSQQMNDRRELLEDLYDGLSSEMALFLLSKSLNILRQPECQRASDCFALIKNALWYRAAPFFVQTPISIENLTIQFQSELENESVKMLLITCPVLQEAGLEFRHSIYVLFYRTDTQIKIQIVNAGLGERFHLNAGDEKLHVRQYELDNPEENQELLKFYLTLLFNLSNKIVQTTDEFMNELANAYRFNGNEFTSTETIFPSQVTGNCTIFGAQWALRIALGLTEAEHDKLTLDFAKGADLLASKIRSHEINESCDFVVLEGLPEDKLKFHCGYESKRRKDFKAPASHSTSEYAPGIPGTNHHIVPQSYLQFLYDELHVTDMPLLCNVLGNTGTTVTKKQFAYGYFDLFHGPSDRSDDPKDDTTDPLNNEQGIEQKQPIGFPKARWDALQEIGSTLRDALNNNTTPNLSVAQKTQVISQLKIIEADPMRTTCFKEVAPQDVWEIDSTTVATKYKLKTPPLTPVSTTTSTSSGIFGSSTTSSGAAVPPTSGPGGP